MIEYIRNVHDEIHEQTYASLEMHEFKPAIYLSPECLN
jgi:hypothetical protein